MIRRLFSKDSILERLLRAALVAGALYAQAQGWLTAEAVAILGGSALMIHAGDKN